MTRPRPVNPPTVRPSMPTLATLAVAVVAALLGGCAASPAPRSEASAVPVRPASSVLVLPSATQRTLAADSGIPSSRAPGRRDATLGGPVLVARGPATERVDVRSDQRLVNGRVFGTVRWRSRSTAVQSR